MAAALPLLITFAVNTLIAVGVSLALNWLFPTHTEGPRLDDLRVQSSAYGRAIPLLYGAANRVAGNVIWSSGLIETANEQSAKGGPTVTNYSYRTSVAVGICEGVGTSISKVWANGKLIYDAAESPTHIVFDTLTFYPGNFTQNPDPTIESFLGVGNVPGYRGTAYAVIKDLQLADFGNGLPNIEFLVVKNAEDTVSSIAEDIATRCGIPANNFTGCIDTLANYAVGKQMSGSSALRALTIAWNFDIVDDAGDLRMVERDRSPEGTINLADLGAHQAGSEWIPPLEWKTSRVTALPREVAVIFADANLDYQANTAFARRSEGTSEANISVELPMAITAEQAVRVADRLLWEAWIAQTGAIAHGTDKHIDVRPGRTYLFETPAGFEPLRVTTKTRGANGVYDFELKRDRSEVYQSTQTGIEGSIPVKTLNIPGESELITLDIPILRDVDDDAGFYYAVTIATDNWRGAQVLRALGLADDYATIESIGVEAIVGNVHGTLPDGVTEGFDDVTVLEVTLRRTDMILASVSDEAIAAGENLFFVGDPDNSSVGEIIQAGTIVETSAGTWELSHLKRGLKGTEFSAPDHGGGEILVKLSLSTTHRDNFGVVDLNLERAYKAVSLLWSPDDVPGTLFTNTGAGLRPYSPVDLEVHGDTGGDLLLSWTRRSRLTTGALGEVSELYTVRIMDPTGTTILRETQVAVPEFDYTVAMQTADFGGAVSDLRWRVAQVSGTYGNGIFAEKNSPIPVSGSG